MDTSASRHMQDGHMLPSRAKPGFNAADEKWYDPILAQLRVPSAFSLEVWSEAIPSVRTLALSPSGTVFAANGRGQPGRVYACRDTNHNGNALDDGECFPVTEPLNQPNGLVFLNGDLFIAVIGDTQYASSVLVIRDVEIDPTNIKPLEVLIGPESSPGAADGLPLYTHHGWRAMAASPDGSEIAVAVGARAVPIPFWLPSVLPPCSHSLLISYLPNFDRCAMQCPLDRLV
jgi:glucose/arabinose dehydrogenase